MAEVELGKLALQKAMSDDVANYWPAGRRDVLRLRAVRFRLRFRDGTLAPFSLASFKPMAIACLRLVTLRPEPLFSVPRLRRRIADFTVFDAPLPYFAMDTSSTPRADLQVPCSDRHNLLWRLVVGGW